MILDLKHIKINTKALYYFIGSWLFGGILYGLSFYNEDFFGGFWFLAIGFNFIINSLIIIYLTVLFLVFTENRLEFFWSIALLLFNLPFIAGYFFLFDFLIWNT